MNLTDVNAERAVLGGILQYGQSCYFDIADCITENSFSDYHNQLIFCCVKHTIEKLEVSRIDLPLLLSTATSLGLNQIFSNAEELKKLNSLFQIDIRSENVRKLASKLGNLEIARSMYKTLTDLAKQYLTVTGEESISSILSIAEEGIFNFASTLDASDNEPQKVFQHVEERLQYLKDNPRQLLGVSTGFPRFDECIGGGLRPGTISVVGARAKIGKSILAGNIGVHIAKNLEIPVLNLDTEMRIEDQQDRLMAMLSEVKIKDIETGKFGKCAYTTKKLFNTSKLVQNIPYFYSSIGGLSFDEQIATVRRWIIKQVGLRDNGKAKDCVIIYDYLKLMSASDIRSDLKEFQVLGFTMTALHNFALRYEVPILAFIQLNRDGITKESTDAVSGSDRIIWLCSNFSIYKDKSTEEINADGPLLGNRKLIPVISRHGKGMGFGNYINFNFQQEYGKVVETYTKDEAFANANQNSVPFTEPTQPDNREDQASN